MPKQPKKAADTAATVGYEAQLWQMADALREAKLWLYGAPPARIANFASAQHIVNHLSPARVACVGETRLIRRGVRYGN